MNANSYERNFTRGDIFYIYRGPSCGSEQMSGRPAVIVSNDKCNAHSSTLEVVFLTTQPKRNLPTHVSIRSSPKPSTALCEQISTVDTSRIGDYVGTCTAQEMNAIDAALMVSIGIDEPCTDFKVSEVIKEVPVEAKNRDELIAARAQIAQLQAMYNSLLEKFIAVAR